MGVSAGTSFLRSDADDQFSGDLVSSARNKGIFGVYDSTKTDHIWSMGANYRNSSTGADFGNLYGLAYKHTNNTTGGNMGGGHQMVWCTNGTPKGSIGENRIWAQSHFFAAGNTGGSWDTNNNTALTFTASLAGTAYNVLRVDTDNGFKLQTLGGTGGTQRWYTSNSNYIQFSGTTITASLNGTASNAALLDNIDSSQFLRSDATDTATGALTFGTQTWNGHITWNNGMNIGVAGESSFDVSGSGVFQIWDSGTGAPFIKCDVGQRVEIGQAGSRGLKVHGDFDPTGTHYVRHGGSDYSPNISFLGGSNVAGSNAYENGTIGYYDNSGTGTMQYGINRGSGTHKFNIGGNTVFYVDSGGQGRFIGSTDIGLVVQSNDAGSGITIKDSNTGGDYYNGMFCATNDLFFKSNNVERLRINSSGLLRSVGDVVVGPNNNNSKPFIRAKNGYDTASTPSYSWYYDNGCGIGHPAGSVIAFSTGSNERGRFTNSGLSVTGSISASADVVAYASSDKRLKDNIKNIANPLEKLNKLNGIEFDWNDKQDLYKGHDIGVIAQEVEEVLPEIVDTREDGHKAVKYDRMVALLIEAVKEQQKQINKLEEKLNG